MSAHELKGHIDPQTSPYFYLSYARADDESKVRQFFNDLSDSIRIRAELALTQVVGSCAPVEQDAGDRDRDLRTSRLMIALLSPAYFEDERSGREWEVFEMRKAKSSGDRSRSIIPIPWLPYYSGPIPRVISETPIFGKNFNRSQRQEPVVLMLRSPKKHGEYAEFVNRLANYIVDSTASFQLPEMDSIPDEVPNAFEAKVEPPTNSEPNGTMPKQILNQNLLIIDAAFARSLAEQIKETADRPTAGATAGPSGEPTQSRKAANEKYLVFVIHDEPEDVKKIAATAGFSREFDVKTYEKSSDLLNEISSLLENRQEPDLVVLNPELIVPETHRFRLIDALLEKKVPSAILAISKDPDAAGGSLKSAGIKDLVAILQKPFTSVDLLQRMRHWAKIGRDKRYRRARSGERSVFLSFSSQNAAMASKLCNWLELREIGVWYTAEFLEAGDPWRDKVAEGLAEAKVFIPLISDDYLLSEYCDGELANTLDRLEREAEDLRVIPVLYNPSSQTLDDPQIKACLNRHAVTISDRDWPSGFQQILLSVQSFLSRRQNQS